MEQQDVERAGLVEGGPPPGCEDLAGVERDVGAAVLHALVYPPVIEAGRQPVRQAERPVDQAQRQHPTIGGRQATLETGDDRLVRDQ
jgi:hypothetical protein